MRHKELPVMPCSQFDFSLRLYRQQTGHCPQTALGEIIPRFPQADFRPINPVKEEI
jgi:hypothetical protein